MTVLLAVPLCFSLTLDVSLLLPSLHLSLGNFPCKCQIVHYSYFGPCSGKRCRVALRASVLYFCTAWSFFTKQRLSIQEGGQSQSLLVQHRRVQSTYLIKAYFNRSCSRPSSEALSVVGKADDFSQGGSKWSDRCSVSHFLLSKS
jgi:hypothetical protein